MSFWMYLLAVFCSPAYFGIRGKWGSFIVNSVLYLLALATVMVFGIGIFFWLLGVGHALWDLSRTMREQAMRRQAQLIAESLKQNK